MTTSPQGTVGPTASAARDGAIHGGPAQSTEHKTHHGLSATQPLSYTDTSSQWNASHEDVSAAPMVARDTHPHAELVLSLTDEINQLENKNRLLTTANQACMKYSGDLYQEKVILLRENAELKRLLKQHAPHIQLPPRLAKADVDRINPALTAVSCPTSSKPHNVTSASTSATLDLTQDDAGPLPAPALPPPVSTNSALKKKKATSLRDQLPEVQLEYLQAEIQASRKEILKLKDDQGSICDVVIELARIERYLTSLCIRYADFVEHMEKEYNFPGMVAAAKKWIAGSSGESYHQRIQESIASAAARGHGGYQVPSAAGPTSLNGDDRKNSTVTIDSGYDEAVSHPNMGDSRNSGQSEDWVPHTTPPDMLLPPTMSVPRPTYDGNRSSPEFVDTTTVQTDGDNAQTLPQTDILEDDPSATGPPGTFDDHDGAIHNLGVLQGMKNTGNSHGDAYGVLAELGTGFNGDNNPRGTQVPDLATLEAELQNTLTGMGYTAAVFETENMPDTMITQPTSGPDTGYYQPDSQTSYGVIPAFSSTSDNHDMALPNIPGGLTHESGHEFSTVYADIDAKNCNDIEAMSNYDDAGNLGFDESFESYTSYLGADNEGNGDAFLYSYSEFPEPSAN